VLHVAGYLCALVGAVLLLALPPAGRARATGGAVLAVLVLLEVMVDDGGARTSVPGSCGWSAWW
jgi:hypothetical protein